MKDRLCNYGNCQIETSQVVLSWRGHGERPAFCGPVHAALYLLKHEGHAELSRQLEEALANPQSKRIGVVCL